MTSAHEYAIKLFKTYKYRSIFLKYFIILFVLLIIPFSIMGYALCSVNESRVSAEINSSIEKSFNQSSFIIEDMFSKIEKQYGMMSYDSDILTFFGRSEINHDIILNRAISNIYDDMESFKTVSPFIDSIICYSEKNNYVLSTNGGNYIEKLNDISWYNEYKKNQLSQYIIPSNFDKNGISKNTSICYCLHSGTELRGIIVFNIDNNYIKSIFTKDFYDNLYLSDINNNIFYSLNGKIPENTNGIRFSNKNNIEKSKSKNIMTISKGIMSGNLNLTCNINLKKLSGTSSSALYILISSILIAILLILAIAIYISSQFYLSISRIITSLNSDNLEVYPNKSSEIEYIISNISNMIRLNKNFEIELVNKLQLLKKMQSTALQLQFNPHFVFNTLNIVNAFICNNENKNDNASKLIILLCDLLHISLSTDEHIVTFQDELIYTKKYIEIMKIHYENNFDITYDIDESLYDNKVLKLMLQPIIENAFEHGIKRLPKNADRHISISAKSENSNLIIHIYNNGPTPTSEELDNLILTLKNDSIITSKHVGLNNINQRIKLTFGEKYGCNVISHENVGFTVVITLPYEKY